MFTRYVVRGVKAGIIAGLLFGIFVALVSNPLVGYAETFESGDSDTDPTIGGITSIIGGVFFGILLGGIVFGGLFYFLEPAIPGTGWVKSYALAAAGFITVSGAPWLVFPPQPPGVTQTLPTGVRITWYLILMVAGAVACGAAGAVYNHLRARHRRLPSVTGALVPFTLVVLVVAVNPTNPVSGPIPETVATIFVLTTVGSQIGLWIVLASVHARLHPYPDDSNNGPATVTGPPTPE